MLSTQNEKQCKKLTTLTSEELRRAQRAIPNPVLKTPFSSKLFASLHKRSAHCTPHRPKSRDQQYKFDKVLREKLVQKFCGKVPARNYMSVMERYVRRLNGSGSKKRRKKQSVSVLRNEAASKLKRPYYGNISLNLSKLLRRKSGQSPSMCWTEGKAKKSKRAPKSVVKHLDDKELVITANSSYIHNFNVSPGMLFYSNHSKDYPSATHAESFISKDLAKSSKAIELKLDKRLSAVSDSDNYERSLKTLNAYKEAFHNIIALDPYFGGLLERIKNSYESFIEVLVKRQEEEIVAVKEEVMAAINDKIEELKTQLPKASKSKKKTPKLYLDFRDRDEGEETSQKKPKVPQLDLKKLERGQGYHDEFMEREKEFSPSWREQLAEEKRF
eukprot:TRINITY_DN5866_c0_g1_i25.p1 TRINITY_DN5866_c0_g1~~TRINITY_DN5866_c0_g1_i25.p1  ORF type:complete len:386 (+),score=105.78 TRINITY_DN5866_c0_g1_i25:147-1304(+)